MLLGGAAPLSPDAVASLLNTLIVLTGGGNSSSPPFSEAGVEAAAAMVFEVTRSAYLSDASVTASVLSVLSCVAGGAQTLNGSASGNIVGALSNVAVALGGAASLLQRIAGTLDSLASSQAAALAAAYVPGAPPPPPFISSSPTIHAAVQVFTPASGVALALAPVPGSPSAFQPIPAAALVGVGSADRQLSQYSSLHPIVAKFHSLAFDPHGGNASTGSTRLELSTLDGAALEVANATQPILFSLPIVPRIPAGSQAVCSFWDTDALSYSTGGCIALPSPQPPQHAIAFKPSYATPSDASLAASWTISGSLFDPDACQQAVLDCSSDAPCDGPGPWGRNCSIDYPNPRAPLTNPSIACPADGSPVALRVIYGARCKLWQPGNALNCSWSNLLQSFVGPGCVAAPGNATQCMCRHLTDFSSSHVVAVPACSLAQMDELTPDDVITKLRVLLVVIVIMFVLMHLTGAVCAIYEKRERSNVVQLTHTPAMGFEQAMDGAWTWRLEHEPMTKAVGAPSGG